MIHGKVVRFPAGLKVPHLGWNQVFQKGNPALWNEIPDGSFFYFAHSYFGVPVDADVIAGETEYGVTCAVAIRQDDAFRRAVPSGKIAEMGAETACEFHRDGGRVMLIIPAIDLLGGKAVRLSKGVEASAVVYSDRPAAMAAEFEAAGAKWIHVVDLDAAFGRPDVNAAAVERILRSVRIPVELGGGVRDAEKIRFWLDKGVGRVISGIRGGRKSGSDARTRWRNTAANGSWSASTSATAGPRFAAGRRTAPWTIWIWHGKCSYWAFGA